MKFAAIVVGLIGLTSVNALATPGQASGLQVRQDGGLITQLNETIDALQAQLTDTATTVNEAVQIQATLNNIQALLNFLTT